MKGRFNLVLALLTLGLGAAAQASAGSHPIAVPGTEGFKVIVASPDSIIATFQGNSGSFSNDLYLMLDGGGNPGDDGDFSNDRFIFNNLTSTVGDTQNLGSFAGGTELIFRLHVTDTDEQFYTGPAARNADNAFHARVQAEWQPNETLVSFEDLFDGPYDFNDLSFSFTNTVSQPVPVRALSWGALKGQFAGQR